MKDKTSLSESILEDANQFSIDKNNLDRLDSFVIELDLISDVNIRKLVESALIAADSFWVSPSSFVPLDHPKDEYGTNGLVLHTKRVLKSLAVLAEAVTLSTHEKDCLLAAGFLHDVTKAVWANEEKTAVIHDEFHCYTVDAFLKWAQSNNSLSVDLGVDIKYDTLDHILRLIRCSEGYYSIIPETIPLTIQEKLLCMADLVAKNLHLIIDEVEKDSD